MKKILLKVHLWLSVPVGIIIAIICFSGAMLVFETELMELFNPQRYKVEQVKDAPLPMETLMAIAQSSQPDSMRLTEVQVSRDPSRNYRMGFGGRNRTAVFVDQYSGEVREMYTPGDNFFVTMRKLHRWLLDDYQRDSDKISIGKTAVGVSTLFFVFILITGIIVWIPKTRKALVNSFKINTRKGKTRLWHDLHVTLGVYSAVILLALALTGLTWSFEWYNKGFYAVFGLEVPQRGPGGPGGGPQSQRQNPASSFQNWDKVIAEVKRIDPKYRTITLRDETATVATDAIRGNKRASNRYTFDTQTGEITGAILYADMEANTKLRGWIYSVHFGSFGGMVTKIMFFLASMLGASLPITGYYIWISKSIKKRRKRKEKERKLEKKH